MSHQSVASTPERPSRRTMYGELTKIRLSALVLVTAAVGYLLGSPGAPNWLDACVALVTAVAIGDWSAAGDIGSVMVDGVAWVSFAILLVGVMLAAAGTSAVNQWMEVDRDAAMDRTRTRPLPAGSMSRAEALVVGTLMIAVGGGMVMFLVNELAGFLTLLTATIYILIYTPLKTRTSLNTLVGAVCGAIPPMIGWAAAAENLALGAWLLGGVLFVWQLPHFLALAWMYRDDYAKGGFRMLPLFDSGGELTSRIVVTTAVMLVPLSLMFVLFGVTGYAFALIGALLGGWFIWQAMRMYHTRSRPRARAVFLASIAYLPVLLGVMVLDQRRVPVRAILYERQLQDAAATMDADAPNALMKDGAAGGQLVSLKP